jgi:hypothetical protein
MCYQRRAVLTRFEEPQDGHHPPVIGVAVGQVEFLSQPTKACVVFGLPAAVPSGCSRSAGMTSSWCTVVPPAEMQQSLPGRANTAAGGCPAGSVASRRSAA